MQRISPLKSSIEAFNKFRAARANKADKTNEVKENNSAAQTNPFGITFKGNIIQMDVFESSKSEKTGDKTNTTIQEKLQNTGKLLASAWVGTMNKFSSLKTNAIAFGNKVKNSVVTAGKKLQEIGNTEVKFSNPFKYNVSYLQTRSVDELGTMLANELQGVK